MQNRVLSRNYLQLFFLLLSTQILATWAQSATSADVLIIGAGASGLAAASKLKSKGVNVIVLEGRNRVGGRTYTVNSKDADGNTIAINLGASWIHGVVGNPLVPLAKAANVPLSVKNTNYDNSDTYGYNGALQRTTPLTLNGASGKIFWTNKETQITI